MEYGLWATRDTDAAVVCELEQHGFHPLAARVLAARGIATPAEARAFLDTSTELLHDPLLLSGMEEAVSRIRTALQNQEKIAVYGDYDADGVTATALMLRTLKSMGGDAAYHIPNRLTDGYGLHREALESLKREGVTLLITVDTGITALEEVRWAGESGMDVVITDHHECREALPSCIAVVNPRRTDCSYPYKTLAGVGVAFKLCCALTGDTKRCLAQYGDLVAIGTVADVMPVTGENRILINAGLQTLNRTRLPGLQALLRKLGKKNLRATDIGYLLGPRINAAGRMGRADTALQLLLTEDPAEAMELAQSLCELNDYRRQIEESIRIDALRSVDGTEAAIVPVGESWHQGVAGIVAASLQKRFNKPVFMVCLDGDIARGSARGQPGYHLVELLGEQAHLLDEYGGHEQAAGFVLPRRNVADFKDAIIRACARVRAVPPELCCEADIRPEWLDIEGLRALESLEPFGTGFPAPVFALKGLLLADSSPMGQGKHCRLGLQSNPGRLNAVWFGRGTPGLPPDTLCDAAFEAGINRFQGNEAPQLQIIDLRTAGDGDESRDALALYRRFAAGERLSVKECEALLPSREDVAAVWRSLGAWPPSRHSILSWGYLLRRRGVPDKPGKVWVAVDALCELGLCRKTAADEDGFALERLENAEKRNLKDSALLGRLHTMGTGGDEA